jgi:hypothetical protein
LAVALPKSNFCRLPRTQLSLIGHPYFIASFSCQTGYFARQLFITRHIQAFIAPWATIFPVRQPPLCRKIPFNKLTKVARRPSSAGIFAAPSPAFVPSVNPNFRFRRQTAVCCEWRLPNITIRQCGSTWRQKIARMEPLAAMFAFAPVDSHVTRAMRLKCRSSSLRLAVQVAFAYASAWRQLLQALTFGLSSELPPCRVEAYRAPVGSRAKP